MKSSHLAIAAKILGTDWLAYTVHVKVTLKSSHLAIPLNSQEIQAQPPFLLV